VGVLQFALDNVIFAIIIEDRLYFKADTKSRGDFLDLGLRPFTYESNGKAVSMSYFEAPSEVYDDPEAMLVWARKAIEAAVRARKPSPGCSSVSQERRVLTS